MLFGESCRPMVDFVPDEQHKFFHGLFPLKVDGSVYLPSQHSQLFATWPFIRARYGIHTGDELRGNGRCI
jgi:hypothetical protein